MSFLIFNKRTLRKSAWYAVQRNFKPAVQSYYKQLQHYIRRFRLVLFPTEFLRDEDLMNEKVFVPIDFKVFWTNKKYNSSKQLIVNDIFPNLKLKCITDSIIYNSFYQVINSNEEWSNTFFFKNYSKIMNVYFSDYPDKESFFTDISKIIKNFDQAVNSDSFASLSKELWCISINISSSGQALLNTGLFKLILCYIFNSREVTCQVVARHSSWINFKKKLLLLNNESLVYSPLYHFDLKHIKTATSGKRFDHIKKNLDIMDGKVLDIGAAWGYYCHKFVDEGFDCTAIENDPNAVYFMRNLSKACGRKFEILNKNILSLEEKDLKFDIILAFSIFHHFVRTENLYNEFIDFLGRIETKEMYFLSGYPLVKNLSNFKYLDPEEFAKLIVSNSCLTNYEMLADSLYQNRVLFRIYK